MILSENSQQSAYDITVINIINKFRWPCQEHFIIIIIKKNSNKKILISVPYFKLNIGELVFI